MLMIVPPLQRQLGQLFIPLGRGADVIVEGDTLLVVIGEVTDQTATASDNVQIHGPGVVVVLPQDAEDALRIFLRDRYNHKSPNSAQTESACAGALQVRLAGDAYYFGELVRKPYIGDDIRPIETEDIKRACRLMMTTAYLCAAICFAAGCFVL